MWHENISEHLIILNSHTFQDNDFFGLVFWNTLRLKQGQFDIYTHEIIKQIMFKLSENFVI